MEAVQSASSVSNVVDPAFGVGDHHVHIHEDAWNALGYAGEDGGAWAGSLCWLLRQTLNFGEEAQTHRDIRDKVPAPWSCELCSRSWALEDLVLTRP